MMRRRLLGFIAVLCPMLAVAFHTGCVKIKKAYPDKRNYVLEAQRPDSSPRTPPRADSISVRNFTISPRYESGELVYRQSEFNYAADFYNRFFVSPEILVAEETRTWLKHSGMFRNMLEPGSHAIPQYILEGCITTMQGDFRKSPLAVLEIQFLVSEGADAPGKILMQKDYRQEVPLPKAEANALVQGLNQALEQILQGFEADLRTALP